MHMHVHTCIHTHIRKRQVKEHSICVLFFISTYDKIEVWWLLSQPYINKYLLSLPLV